MSRSVPALINHNVLVWAREQGGYSCAEVAGRLKIEENVLTMWESGHERPSVAKTREMAQLYRRPLALFYLKHPPKSYDVIKDFRRLPGSFRREESPELLWVVRQARYRREVALNLMRESGEKYQTFEEKGGLAEGAESLGARIRAFLGISLEEQLGFKSEYDALNAWKDAVEEKGMLVFQASRIHLSEMRAFCLPEETLPVILLNSADSTYGRLFSLIHELVHLYLVHGGTIRTDEDKRFKPENQRVEVFANAVAAAVLLPLQAFQADTLIQENLNTDWPDNVLHTISNRYSVSRETILRRLVTIGFVSESLYRTRRALWEEQWKNAPKKEGGGAPPPPVLALSRVGHVFGRIVLESYQRGAITLNDVSYYFDMKPKWLPEFEHRLASALVKREAHS